MKKIYLLFSVFSVLMFSCSKENPTEFNQTMVEAHDLVISEATVPETGGDIELDFNVSYPNEGVLFYAISSTEIPEPNAYQIINSNLDADVFGKFPVSSTISSSMVTLPGAEFFYIYSVIRTSEDAISPVVIDVVEVNDVTGPYLIGNSSSPKPGELTSTTPVIDLYFNEKITLGDSFSMMATSITLIEGDLPNVTEEVVVTKEDIVISGNTVKVYLDNQDFTCGNILVLTAAAGSFKDISGNNSDKIGWVHNGEEFVSIDYYVEMKDDTVNEIMQNFIGVNSYLDFLDGVVSSGLYDYDVKLKDCTESTVLLRDFFDIEDDLEFTFNLETRGITLEEYEASIYFDSVEGTFYLRSEDMILDPTYQHRVFYSPVSVDSEGNTGKYSLTEKMFYVSYSIRIENLGILGTVVTNYSKKEQAAMASTQSATIKSEYAEAILKFKNR